jgi:hypothetical protein
MATSGSVPGGHEADHSPINSAVVKIGRAIPPFPHMPLWRGV